MIVGTAGHVDHGKTSLVRALTGVDTDRLKEEKARGISIDLGFAYMAGQGGAIGFVDVPGHERLVRTMIAGAAGIDFALLVVAADDGVMPQTREHIDVLDLLGLDRGIVAVTKVDRIDPERRAGLADAITGALAGTGLADAPLAFVSTVTGEGIDALRENLAAAAAATPHAVQADGVFRLSVDRAFTLQGVGTVATGTALAGLISLDDDVTVLPGRSRARVRSLHAQNRQATAGLAGERCALNLAGIGKDEVARGTWLCAGREPLDTARFDASVRLLEGERKPLRAWAPATVHCGASAIAARIIPLSGDALEPGSLDLVQVTLERPLPLRHGDRFVLRDPGAQRTLGGGRVIDPRAPARRRRSSVRLRRLAAMQTADPRDALDALLALDPGFEDVTAFADDRGLTAARRDALLDAPGLVRLAVGQAAVIATLARWDRLVDAVTARLGVFHAENPEQPGLAGEHLRVELVPGLPKPLFAAIRERLAAEGHVGLQGHWLHLPGHVAQLGPEERRIAAVVTPLIAGDRFRPPRVRDLGKTLAFAEVSVRRACKALVRTGDYIEVAHDHFFLRGTVAEMAAIADDLSRSSNSGFFSAAEFRDRLDNGRKVAIQILEFFDRHGLTRRAGDLRRVVKAPGAVFGAAPVRGQP